jgi:hypothetical protein
LKNIVISASVEMIGANAIVKWQWLASVTFEAWSVLHDIGVNTFELS